MHDLGKTVTLSKGGERTGLFLVVAAGPEHVTVEEVTVPPSAPVCLLAADYKKRLK